MKILNMVIPIVMYFCNFCLKLECCKPKKATGHLTKFEAINDLKLFPTVYPKNFDIQSDAALQKHVN